jgi:hypothetical protein
MRITRHRIAALALGLVLAGATATRAVVIYFKDGSQEIVATSYRIDGKRLIATLQSGQETAIPLDAVDLERTESIGRVAKGSAIVVDTAKPEGANDAPPRYSSLRDLMRDAPALKARGDGAAAREPLLTPIGNLDLFSAPRQPVAPPARGEAIAALLQRQGLRNAEAFQGTAANRVLLDLVTASRNEVFSALEASAALLLELRASDPGIGALELVMATSSRSRAGQFVLTPGEAERLQSGAVTPAEHFVANVLF